MATTKVACKLPQGLTVEHEGKTVTLAGANHPHARFGHGFTEVDADWFKSWTDAHADFPPIKNRLIFAHKDAENAAKEAAGDKSIRSGAEPLDPSKPGAGVEPTDEQKKELAKLPSDPTDPLAK